jgi:hypothetical protein
MEHPAGEPVASYRDERKPGLNALPEMEVLAHGETRALL